MQTQVVPQVLPVACPPVGREVHVPEQLAWSSVAQQQQQHLPGTPRASTGQTQDSPSTPLNRVVRSSQSPALPSPWMQRTPSPDCHGATHHAHFDMSRASQQSQGPSPPEADPWANTTLMVATRSYFAESEGYLSVAVGSAVRAMIDNPHCGEPKCAWPTYVYCCQGSGVGWVPQQLLWRCYVDDTGRRWACEDATGTWCWVDEMEKNEAQIARC
jgi:hypothetical protein